MELVVDADWSGVVVVLDGCVPTLDEVLGCEVVAAALPVSVAAPLVLG